MNPIASVPSNPIHWRLPPHFYLGILFRDFNFILLSSVVNLFTLYDDVKVIYISIKSNFINKYFNIENKIF